MFNFHSLGSKRSFVVQNLDFWWFRVLHPEVTRCTVLDSLRAGIFCLTSKKCHELELSITSCLACHYTRLLKFHSDCHSEKKSKQGRQIIAFYQHEFLVLKFNSSLMFVQMICIRKGKVMNDFLVSFTNIITVALKNMLMVVNSKVHKRSLFSLLCYTWQQCVIINLNLMIRRLDHIRHQISQLSL